MRPSLELSADRCIKDSPSPAWPVCAIEAVGRGWAGLNIICSPRPPVAAFMRVGCVGALCVAVCKLCVLCMAHRQRPACCLTAAQAAAVQALQRRRLLAAAELAQGQQGLRLCICVCVCVCASRGRGSV